MTNPRITYEPVEITKADFMMLSGKLTWIESLMKRGRYADASSAFWNLFAVVRPARLYDRLETVFHQLDDNIRIRCIARAQYRQIVEQVESMLTQGNIWDACIMFHMHFRTAFPREVFDRLVSVFDKLRNSILSLDGFITSFPDLSGDPEKFNKLVLTCKIVSSLGEVGPDKGDFPFMPRECILVRPIESVRVHETEALVCMGCKTESPCSLPQQKCGKRNLPNAKRAPQKENQRPLNRAKDLTSKFSPYLQRVPSRSAKAIY